jgi:hypothetical protein
MQKKLNVFQFNVKLFNIAGVIPSENINSSSWKFALFRIFQVLSLLLDISMMTLQFLGIYYYWGNLNVIADIIGILAASVFLNFIGSYTNIFWKNICDVTDTFETNSIFCSELVRSNPKHMKIVNETVNQAKIYNKLISMTVNLEPIIYILPTFVQHLMTSDDDIIQVAETVDGITKYFPFVIWLPPGIKQEIIIRVIYGLQCIYLWEMFLLIAAIAPFYTVVFLFTGAQFKLISSIIREMEVVMCMVENPGNERHEVSEQIFANEKKELSSSLQQCYINQQSASVQDISSPEIKSTTKNDRERFYLLECIKLHQACIK